MLVMVSIITTAIDTKMKTNSHNCRSCSRKSKTPSTVLLASARLFSPSSLQSRRPSISAKYRFFLEF